MAIRVGYNESDEWQRDCYPDARAEYSTYPIVCYTSEPCVVATPVGRSTIAVYVWARRLIPTNDGDHNEWEGWVEIPDFNAWVNNPDWSFVENIYTGKTINVAKWKYLTN